MSQKEAVLEYLRNTPLSTPYPHWDACTDSVHILISRPVQKDVELLLFFDQVGYSFTTKCYWYVCMVKPGASLEDCDWRGSSGCSTISSFVQSPASEWLGLLWTCCFRVFHDGQNHRINSPALCPAWPRKCSLETVKICSLPTDYVNLRLRKRVFTTAANLSSFHDQAL